MSAPQHYARMEVGMDGWCSSVMRDPSPNFEQRPEGVTIDLLVIHNISLPAGQFGGTYIGDLFGNRLNYAAHSSFEVLRTLKVSAHFLIRRDGCIVQFVSANDKAWHAGVSVFAGRERCNDFSIGIELEGTDFDLFTLPQYAALVALTQALQLRYPLTDVAGHEHIARGRKTDPGPSFDWESYQKALREAQLLALTHHPLRFPSFD